MDNFVVSARKYRPASFDTVVGQKNLTSTLKNAIKTNQLAHAYLFCGPRGVGKTTCARIFAKTINCQEIEETGEACNKCESCFSFNDSKSFNVHELDAASNNSVDDIRSLIDKVRIPPQMGKYNVYIIDEVHMLSASAFNAFLKTLEEPPSYAIFILATTEKHKIIPTILSRCQVYDFNRITIEDIVEQLSFIADKENVVAEPEALGLIAQKSDGAMRDALSIFDQLVSFSGGNITYHKALETLNVLDYEYYFKLTKCFLKADAKQALLIFDEILDKGFDGQYFISGLSSHFRDILVCKDSSTVKLLEVGASIKERYLQQAGNCEVSFLYEAMKITNEFDLTYKASQNKRFHIELALMRLSYFMEEKKNSDNRENAIEEEREEPVSKSNAVIKESEVAIAKESSSIPHEQVKEQEKVMVQESVSIKDMMAGKKEEKDCDEISENDQELRSNFSAEQLNTAINIFTEKLKSEKPRMYNTLKSCSPVLNDDFVIKVSFINDLQESTFNDIKGDFLDFLKTELKNTCISLVTEIEVASENAKPLNRLYSDDDRFKFMCEKNGNLMKLKEVFKLDFLT